MKPVLNEKQLKNWKLLASLLPAFPTAAQMTAAVKQFALLVIAEQYPADNITVNHKLFETFGPKSEFSSKAKFLHYYQRPRTWANETLLIAAADALGYDVDMKLPGSYESGHAVPEYNAVEQSFDTGLKMVLVNHGAKYRGNHWSLDGETTPGDGDCGYHSLRQQIAKDLPRIPNLENAAEEQLISKVATVSRNTIKPEPVTKVVTAKTAIEKQPFIKIAKTLAPKPEPKATITEEDLQDTLRDVQRYVDPKPLSTAELISAEQTKTFRQLDSAAEQRFNVTAAGLMRHPTQELILAYRKLVKNNPDSYLKGRPKEVTRENGGDDFLERALKSNAVNHNYGAEIRRELVHMLAREAWRSTDSFEQLTEFAHELEQRQRSSNMSVDKITNPRPIAVK